MNGIAQQNQPRTTRVKSPGFRVLVVDDSRFFRHRLIEALEVDGDIQVVGEAADGERAVYEARRLRPDLITMDIHMPVLDGIGALRRIMQCRPIPVLMVSALTRDGARCTLEALEAGAVDFITKNASAITGKGGGDDLRRRVREIAASWRGPAASAPVQRVRSTPEAVAGPCRAVVIGSSTGGPVALQQIFANLPGDFPRPVLVAQHMPAEFTGPFAERLDSLCAMQVVEARDGDVLRPGRVLIAPGGQQMRLENHGSHGRVCIEPGDVRERYRPSVDLFFSSAAQAFPGRLLAVVLTGMGNDGTAGADRLKQGGATVWTQDEDSSVVYGMPRSVARAGLSDRELSLEQMAPALLERVRQP